MDGIAKQQQSDLLEGKLPTDWKWTNPEGELADKMELLLASLQRAEEREAQMAKRAEEAEARLAEMKDEINRLKKEETARQPMLPGAD